METVFIQKNRASELHCRNEDLKISKYSTVIVEVHEL